ncbi:imidazolonepropionase [Algoriphagus machipongonensis]|uniref:Imidazolonepropionase n=1 Tax=Algoriphagus machipongonensis TaxID=388413 RepID=A3I0P3_9BACT|nr:imidazolonepropionase [Algoriphagus machipongonensis]EAZ80039.1 imidazolonepropionase [Algoriphagus machipongonensis]
MQNLTLIGPVSQLLTMDHLPLRGAIQDESLEIISNAGILLEGELIKAVGNFSELKSSLPSGTFHLIELKQDFVMLPGLIDCHTHICFGGSRARDFAMRNAGKSYLEIAEAGGGIWDTVTQTRKLEEKELSQRTASNANRHLMEGVTTIEVKSGYGLTVSEELKMLRAIQNANTNTAADLISTCLAAHMKPRDFDGSNEEYLEMVSQKLFPILKEENLSNRIDSFIEKSAFSASEIAPYFEKARKLDFDITVHADQFSTGGSKVAVDFNARSADHLEASGEKEIAYLAQSETTAVALPGASLGLGCSFTPARKILDQGGSLAIATDWNPGSAPMGDLINQASILATFEKLSSAEVLAGITFRAAHVLNLMDRGILKSGMLADFILYPSANYQDILYHQGKMKPAQVWKRGFNTSENR